MPTDILHSIDEIRYLRLGKSLQGKIIVISYTVRARKNGPKLIFHR